MARATDHMSTPTITTPVNRTPWVERPRPFDGAAEWILPTSLLRLEVLRSCSDGQGRQRFTISVVSGFNSLIERKDMDPSDVDAAKAEAVRMALRHLANAIISL